MTPDKNGWNEYEKLVLVTLERHDRYFVKLFETMDAVGREITALKIKSGIWGIIGGMVPVVIALSIMYLKTLQE